MNFCNFIPESVIYFILSTIATTLIISISLVISTFISGFNQYNLNHPVDKQNCECSCWDGFFRGIYARKSHDTEYKAFYFNYDVQFIFIIFIFISYADLLRICLVKIFKIKCLKNVRLFILLNLIISIFSNYYGAWVLINYLNDRDYRMINSQIFFSITELMISYIYYKRFNVCSESESKNEMKIWENYFVFFVSVLHLFIAIFEKILWGFFFKNFSQNSRKIRDVNLIINDILGFGLSIKYLFEKNLSFQSHLKMMKFGIIITFITYTFYTFFCSFDK